jgi:hypothetical protein
VPRRLVPIDLFLCCTLHLEEIGLVQNLRGAVTNAVTLTFIAAQHLIGKGGGSGKQEKFNGPTENR